MKYVFLNILVVFLGSIVLSSCTLSQSGLSGEERSYIEQVESVHLPLTLLHEALDSVQARSIWWINRYGEFDLVTSSPFEIETVMPASNLQDGYGYRITSGTFNEELVVKIETYRSSGLGGENEIIQDHFVAKMLGLYITQGILPPNDRVGFTPSLR